MAKRARLSQTSMRTRSTLTPRPGVCEPECPVDAIKPDSQDEPDGKWLKVNTEFAKVWPNITRKGTAPADADAHKDEKGKFEKYFSEKPGTGD